MIALALLLAATPPAAVEPPRQCLSESGRIGNPRPIGRDRLYFPDTRKAGWISRFRGGDCPGVEPLATLIFERQGGLICAGDRVRALNPGSIIPGPACQLGPFERAPAPPSGRR